MEETSDCGALLPVSTPDIRLCQVSSDAVNRTFTALIICEKGNEEGKGEPDSASPHLYNTALFIPEGGLPIRPFGFCHIIWIIKSRLESIFRFSCVFQAPAATRCRS